MSKCRTGVHDPQSHNERVAMEGLDICGYADKWKVAKELALKNERRDGNHLLPYWERVRLLFLELGGAYGNKRRV